MIKYIYLAMAIIAGAIIAVAGVGKLRFADNFAEDRPEYSQKQHKLIGIAAIVAGILLILLSVWTVLLKPDAPEEVKPQKTYCNVCGGDLLCDICGEEGQFCEYSVFKAGDGGHYCSVHWSVCAERYNND